MPERRVMKDLLPPAMRRGQNPASPAAGDGLIGLHHQVEPARLGHRGQDDASPARRTSPPPSGSPHYSPRGQAFVDQCAGSLLIMKASTRSPLHPDLPARHTTTLKSEEPLWLLSS